MIAAPGPDGAAPEPPDWLATAKLPIETIRARTEIHRVHETAFGPVYFGPARGEPPVHRFDSASGRFGVLYAAPGLDAALIETLLRNPERMMIDYSEIARRAVSVLVAGRDLRLVAALGAGLSRIGTTAALATGPYGPCGRWSDALHDHRDAPDGILYASRHDPAEPCVALFERADFGLEVRSTTALVERIATVSAVLDRHGKSIPRIP